MMQCRVYSHTDKFEAEAVIIDKKVLFPMLCREDIEPAKIIDGQCYYPIGYTDIFPKTYNKLIPFSVICEWDDYIDFSDTEVPYPDWVAYYVNWLGYTLEFLKITDEKWGYCNAVTGEIEIPPQWDWCDDFGHSFAIVKGMGLFGVIDDYGEVCIYPDYNSICYVDIKKAEGEEGIFFVKIEMSGKWGAFDIRYSNFEQEMPAIRYKWDDIWWDGWGGYTVMEKTDEGAELFGIVNAGDKDVVQSLTAKPVRYDSPAWDSRKTSYRDGGQCVSFRIISNGDKYGLVADEHNDTETSKLLLEPIHSYEYVIKAADKEDMEWEIAHYARLIARAPAHITTVWENVPHDIIEDVRACSAEAKKSQLKANYCWQR